MTGESPMEKLLGKTLLTEVGKEKSTKQAMQGKDLVALYFSASWCPPCKSFSPLLSSFYTANAKEGKLEIVFVSSDRSVEAFNGYFKTMPYLALPAQNTSSIKNNLAQMLKIQGIPSLIVLDAKTGKYITDDARNQVTLAGDDKLKAKALIASWKATEAVPIEDASLGQGGGPGPIMKVLLFFAKNPIYIIGTFYLLRKLMHKINELTAGDEEPQQEL